MKNIILFLFPLLILTTVSCQAQPNYGKPTIDPEFILKDRDNFRIYYYPEINLDEEFIALDEASQIMDKAIFFESLLTGTFLPLRQVTKSTTYYRLYAMKKDVSENISATVKSLAYFSYQNYKWEGKSLPNFNFTDIDDNTYDSVSTKGSIVVLKFWFIGCVPCVEEMPDLNTLVRKYNNNKDILFISLAYDRKESLQKFLAKTTFKFKVVAAQRKYLIDTLNIEIYPTHFIINRQGIIVKAVRKFEDLKASLEKEIMKGK